MHGVRTIVLMLCLSGSFAWAQDSPANFFDSGDAKIFGTIPLRDVVRQLDQPSPPGWTQQEKPQTTEPAQQRASEPQAAAPPPIIVQGPPPQKTEAEAAEERRERQEKAELDRRLVELTAELAHFTGGLYYATIIVAIATVFLVIATVGLGYFGYRQSRDMKLLLSINERAADATRLAADAAVKAADAATRSAEVAERTMVLNDRPWVSIEIELTGPLIFDAEGCRIDATITLTNHGRSPAISPMIFFKFFASSQKAIEWQIETESWARKSLAKRDVRPHPLSGKIPSDADHPPSAPRSRGRCGKGTGTARPRQTACRRGRLLQAPDRRSESIFERVAGDRSQGHSRRR